VNARVNPVLYKKIRKERMLRDMPVLYCVPVLGHEFIGREVLNCRTKKKGTIHAVNRRWDRRADSGWYVEVVVDYGNRRRPYIMGKDFGGDDYADVAEETQSVLQFVEEVA
jgi:hypothetical protein